MSDTGKDKLISLCIPAHARTYDLKEVMPSLLEAADYSPPVEIVVLDYNSPDDLASYIQTIDHPITYRKYTGKSYYHMAHARNLSILSASGEYIVSHHTDMGLEKIFFAVVRDILKKTNADWLQPSRLKGEIVCRRSVFIEVGGYDERFEFYGPEDRDLADRLERTGYMKSSYPYNLLSAIPTPDCEKTRNYRLKISKREMSHAMRRIYDENVHNNIIVANPDGWGEFK